MIMATNEGLKYNKRDFIYGTNYTLYVNRLQLFFFVN